MARPRVIKLEGDREVRLHNISLEDAERVRLLFSTPDFKPSLPADVFFSPLGQAIIQKEAAEKIISKAAPEAVEAAALPSVAIATLKIGREWYTVEVQFNHETKKAVVGKPMLAGDSKLHAIHEFKKLSVKHNLV